MQVYLTSLGCRLNEAELQMWAGEFQREGMLLTQRIENASLMVINTCAVTQEAARKSRQTIRKLHRKNPTAKLVVTGCYASLEKEEAETLLGVDLVVSNAQKSQLPQLAKEVTEWQSMPYAATEPEEAPLFTRNRERAFIKIQDGCRYRCTYCIVTVARGEEVSRTIDELIHEILELQAEGIKEIVLTGVHVGGYGSDLDVSLYDLVVSILQRTSIPRIRFASVEPWDLHDNFFDLFKDPRLMPHMHLPIQSGSNKILRKMSRRCKTETFLALIDKARSVIPDFNITTDIIVGFPGENDEDFQLSIDIIAQAKFGHVHIFSYSNREGTKAAGLPEQVAAEMKKQRSRELHQVAEKYKRETLSTMLGKQQRILWEGHALQTTDGQFRYFGYTENYHKAYIELGESMNISNQVTLCEIIAVDESGATLVAKPIETLQANADSNLQLNIKQIV
ncbi:tRNA (N(6)-L-threonylcarbamoyladenosine(37)-C(2))-methylthiotransferase MtaB [Aliikangiella maris]|uniref:tRNA (N(6)-L-threonylcarbamoyladenosine(37)-C(2))-methylthiotransferase MtaB n=2 Tax=Aliikangiella maris TaxID=3162458 RepID=A0ABV2BQH7_9GAMM